MNATLARQAAEEVNAKAKTSQYTKVAEVIASAAKAGRFEVTFYDELTDPVKERLKAEGYTIARHDYGRNEIAYIINW